MEAVDYWAYPNRYEIVSGWWSARKEGAFPEYLMPPDGVIVTDGGEPVGALWMYLSYGIGIATLEWPLTKPGLGIKAATVMRTAIEYLKGIAKHYNYGIMRVATLPEIARFLEREGWAREDTEPRIPLILKI